MSLMFRKLSVSFASVGSGLDMVLSSMFPLWGSSLPEGKTLFFRSDTDALYHDWQCICGDMQAVCQDLKDGVNYVFGK